MIERDHGLLRRNEIASLDIGHVDLAGDKLFVVGKGSRTALATALGAGVYHVIAYQLGERASVTGRPHGLRHAAITAALDAFGGDYRKARAFSGHASLETVRRYGDNRADHAGQVVDGLAA